MTKGKGTYSKVSASKSSRRKPSAKQQTTTTRKKAALHNIEYFEEKGNTIISYLDAIRIPEEYDHNFVYLMEKMDNLKYGIEYSFSDARRGLLSKGRLETIDNNFDAVMMKLKEVNRPPYPQTEGKGWMNSFENIYDAYKSKAAEILRAQGASSF